MKWLAVVMLAVSCMLTCSTKQRQKVVYCILHKEDTSRYLVHPTTLSGDKRSFVKVFVNVVGINNANASSLALHVFDDSGQ